MVIEKDENRLEAVRRRWAWKDPAVESNGSKYAIHT